MLNQNNKTSTVLGSVQYGQTFFKRSRQIIIFLVLACFMPNTFAQNGNKVVVIPMAGEEVKVTQITGSFHRDSDEPNPTIDPTPQEQSSHWLGVRFRIVPEPGGEGDNDGRLEVSIDGGSSFGTVCDDFFDDNNNAARVTCRAMGYSDGVLRGRLDVTDGTGATLIDNMKCPDDARTFLDCGINQFGSENCSHAEDVGVTCSVN